MLNKIISLRKSRNIYSALPNPHLLLVAVAAISQTTSAVSLSRSKDYEGMLEKRERDDEDGFAQKSQKTTRVPNSYKEFANFGALEALGKYQI